MIELLDNEFFQPVRNFPKYFVSTLNRWYSIKTNKLIFPVLNKKSGYCYVNLCDRKTRLAHRVLWETFNGPIPKGIQVNHINGIKSDNRLSNLELVSPRGNTKHAHRTGLIDRKGEKNTRTKLSLDDIKSIRQLLEEGKLSQKQIGEQFGIGQSAVSRIKNRSNWDY